MTLLFADSFAHYSAATPSKWDARDATGWTFGTGRFGAGSASLSLTNVNGFAKVNVPATDVLGCGFALFAGWPGESYFFWMEDGSSSQLAFGINAAGKIVVRRGGFAGTLIATSTPSIPNAAWCYVEARAVIHDTTGELHVKVNGADFINLTGLDTKNTANATVSTFGFGYDLKGTNPYVGYSISDLVVWDDAGSGVNDFIGDVRVQAIMPSGDGNSSDLLGSDGNSTNNSLLVDESPPNGDTDYVGSATIGEEDTYAFGNVTPVSGQVFGVQILAYARKDDAGVRSIATVARHSATEEDSADHVLGASYEYHRDIREEKPGGGAWSISDVNAAEFGVKVTA